jgi:hypothetical protein
VADLFQHRYYSPTFKIESDDLLQPIESGTDPSVLLRTLRRKISLEAQEELIKPIIRLFRDSGGETFEETEWVKYMTREDRTDAISYQGPNERITLNLEYAKEPSFPKQKSKMSQHFKELTLLITIKSKNGSQTKIEIKTVIEHDTKGIEDIYDTRLKRFRQYTPPRHRGEEYY